MHPLKKWALRQKVNATAMARGYLLFQVAYNIDTDAPKQDGEFINFEYDQRCVTRFRFYAPADDALETILKDGGYTSVSLLGWNLFAWLTRSKYGSWHGFYLATKKPTLPFVSTGYAASARLT